MDLKQLRYFTTVAEEGTISCRREEAFYVAAAAEHSDEAA